MFGAAILATDEIMRNFGRAGGKGSFKRTIGVIRQVNAFVFFVGSIGFSVLLLRGHNPLGWVLAIAGGVGLLCALLRVLRSRGLRVFGMTTSTRFLDFVTVADEFAGVASLVAASVVLITAHDNIYRLTGWISAGFSVALAALMLVVGLLKLAVWWQDKRLAGRIG